MSITPGGNTPILGSNGRPTNNPLDVLNEHLRTMTNVLGAIAHNTRPDATAVLPHVYTQAEYKDDQHGAMWGSFCLACTDSAGDYVYPCKVVDEPIKPPAFFTIGDVFEPDEHGRMLRHGTPSA